MIELSKPIEDMTLDEIKALERELRRLLIEVIERLAPRPLGVHVGENVGTKDKTG